MPLTTGRKENLKFIVELSVPPGVVNRKRANGKTMPQACKEAEIVEQTYYRCCREFGGLKVDQARRLKDRELKNAKLKRLVTNLSLEKLVLKDIAEGNF